MKRYLLNLFVIVFYIGSKIKKNIVYSENSENS